MRKKFFTVLFWLEVRNRLAMRKIDAMVRELRYTGRDYDFLERGRRPPE